VLLDVGWRIGRRRLAHDAEGARAGFGVVEGSIFGLPGLLLAFTFSGAAPRFDARRQLIPARRGAAKPYLARCILGFFVRE
jgi:hypothetical protein